MLEEAVTATPGTLCVCHVASGDLWAGAEAQIAALIGAQTRLPGLFVCAVILNEGRLAAEARAAGADVTVVPEAKHGFFDLVGHAAQFLQERHVTVLHSHRYKENLLAFAVARKCGIPHLVRTQHGATEPLKGILHLKHTLLMAIDGAIAHYGTDRVISVSEEMSARLAASLPPEKITLVRNGINLEAVQSRLGPQEAKQKLGLAGDTPVVGFAGRLEAVKRVDLLLRAVTGILRGQPAARCVIAGEGRERAALESLARRLGIDTTVHFLGHRDDMYDILRAFDILVLCSDHEGLPMVLLEAANLGLTIVGRRVGGIPEVVRSGETGLLVEGDSAEVLAEACLRALDDRELRRRSHIAGPALVRERFSAEANARAMAQIYRELRGKA